MLLPRIVHRLISSRHQFSKFGQSSQRSKHRAWRQASEHLRTAAVIEELETRQLLSGTNVILDNADAAFNNVRIWNTESSGYQGTVFTADSSVDGAYASWNFSGLPNGQYYLQATWTSGLDRASNATFTARAGFEYQSRTSFTVDQQLSPNADFVSGATNFQTLGVITVTNGQQTIELTNPGANGKIVADAIRLQQVDPTDNSIAVRTERLNQIAQAVYQYEHVYDQLPPGNLPDDLDANNHPYLSWRVYLLPYLGYGDLFQQFHLNEPWNSPNNLPLVNQMPDIFRSRDLAAGSGSTGFQVIQDPSAYHIDANGGPSFRDVLDDFSTTILILETSANNAVPWTAPNDTAYSPTQPLSLLPPAAAGPTLVATMDGAIRQLNPNISATDLHALITWAGGEVITSAQQANIFVNSTQTLDQESQAKLNDLYVALLNYSGTYGDFPLDPNNNPASYFDSNGKPLLSWRVYVLPFLGYQSLYEQFHLDEPWNSPHNLPLANQMPDFFRSRGVAPGSSVTGFQMFTGPNASNGSRNSPDRLSHVTDGTSQTIAIIELPASSAVTWTRPDEDIAFNPASPLAGLGTIPTAGLWTILFDGTTHLLSPAVTAANFAAFVTWNGGETLGPLDYTNVFPDWAAPQSVQERQGNLAKIVSAMKTYASTFGSQYPVNAPPQDLDASGKPFLSWRVYILPYLGYQNLFNQFHLNEPWNSPNNLPLLAKMPDVFRSRGIAYGSDVTGFQVLAGPGAYVQPAGTSSGVRGPSEFGVTDDPANTILVVETTSDHAMEWTRPDSDIPFDPANPLAGISVSGLKNVPAAGVLVGMADGSVRDIKPTIPAAEFLSLATWSGGEIIGPGDIAQSFFDTQFERRIPFPAYDSFANSSIQIRELTQAIHQYESATGGYPPTGNLAPVDYDASGKPKLSWRVYLLPYLGYESLFAKFHLDEAWDSPNNLPLLNEMPEIFRSRGLALGTTKTGFQFISSPQSYNTTINHNQRTGNITDGTSNTIALLETPPELAVNWTQPDDFPFNPADPFASLKPFVSDQLLVSMFDGANRALNPQMDPATAAALITWAGGDDADGPIPQFVGITVQSGAHRFFNVADVATFDPTLVGVPVSKTFTVTNDGTLPLSINSIQVPAGFTLTSNLTSVAANGSGSFTVRFDASLGAQFGGLITLSTNDPDQPTLSFTLSGLVQAPHVAVKEASTTISDGTSTDSFGSAVVGSPVSKTFTVTNSGELPLIVQPVSVPAGFLVTSNFTTNQTIAAGSSATFTVQMVATTKGQFSGTVSFATNDSNHPNFRFTVQGAVGSTPTDIALSKSSVAENLPIGTTVGQFSSTDADVGDTFTYTLVSGTGSDNNGQFSIDATGHLITAASFDYETKNTFSIRVRTTDASGLWFEKPFTISVTNVNDSPVVTGATSVNFTEKGPPVVIDPLIVVNDQDNTTLSAARIIITNYVAGQDQLGFVNDHATMGNISIDLNSGGTMVLASSSKTATIAQWRAALRAVTYTNTSSNPSTIARTVNFFSDDGMAQFNLSHALGTTVTLTAVDDAAVISNVPTTTLNYTENQAALPIAPTLMLSDVDSAMLVGATVNISGNFGEDRLVFTDTSTIHGVYSTSTNTLTLSGTDTVAAYQLALRSVGYFNVHDNPRPDPRVITFQVNDGTLNSNAPTRAVVVTPVNDAPLIYGLETTARPYKDLEPGVPITSTLLVTDADNDNLAGAIVQITGGYQANQDVLAFANTAKITSSWDPSSGTLTLSGVDSVSNYRTALRSVTYANNSPTPDLSPRTISFLADDGLPVNHLSASVSRNVNITISDVAPVLGGVSNTPLVFTEHDPATVVAAGITVTDSDSANLFGATIRISSNYVVGQDRLAFTNLMALQWTWDATTGTLTLTGKASAAAYQAVLRTVTYQNIHSNPNGLPRTVSFQVSDGLANSNTVSRQVTMILVNDPPTISSVETSPLVYATGHAAMNVTSSLLVSDPDSDLLTGAKIVIGTNYQIGVDSLRFINTATITGVWNASSGTLSLLGTDTVSNYRTALRNVLFFSTNTSLDNSARIVSFQVSDIISGAMRSNVATRRIVFN